MHTRRTWERSYSKPATPPPAHSNYSISQSGSAFLPLRCLARSECSLRAAEQLLIEERRRGELEKDFFFSSAICSDCSGPPWWPGPVQQGQLYWLISSTAFTIRWFILPFPGQRLYELLKFQIFPILCYKAKRWYVLSFLFAVTL